MRLTLGLAIAIALLATSCGDDSAVGGDPAALCELARAQATVEDTELDTLAADLDPFIEVAPGDVRSDFQLIRDTFAELEEIEATKGEEAAFAAALAIGNDADLTEAFDNIEQYLIAECNIPPEDLNGEEAGGEPFTESGSCPDVGFVGTISSDGDDENAPFTLTDGEVSLVAAFALSRGSSYTVYLADYDLGDQQIGLDTIVADPGQVVVGVAIGTSDGSQLVVGDNYDVTFVIMDSGGGAVGVSDDPSGSATIIGVTQDRVCFDIEYRDTGQLLQGRASAEVVGGF